MSLNVYKKKKTALHKQMLPCRSGMGKVELTILRLALYEIKHDDDVPEKVAINEAVELAKKFGGDDSPAFINGILAKLV